MLAKLGCRFAMVLASIVFVAACSATSGGAPTEADTTPADATTTHSTQMYALLEANQCLACHVAGDRGYGVSGPSLNGMAARIETYGVAQSAEEYVYEALVNPAAYLPASCPTGQCANVMPSYTGRLSEDELNALVAFLLSLPNEAP